MPESVVWYLRVTLCLKKILRKIKLKELRTHKMRLAKFLAVDEACRIIS